MEYKPKGFFPTWDVILYALARKYGISSKKVAKILLDNDIRSIEDMPDWKDLDAIVQEGLDD